VTSRQRANQPPKDLGRIISISEAVHHASRSLGSTVTWVGAKAGKGNMAKAFQFLRGRFHQQAHLPMTGMVAERNGRAIGGADAALRAEDEEFFSAQPPRPALSRGGEVEG